ncbi:MAG: hypothetical protein SWK76_00195 [Actinomycetota bacterium]|nr:hypothetical protein [Actinomycetota bacterium]
MTSKAYPATKAVDNKSENYTSDPINCLDFESCFVLVKDEGSFEGTITILGALGMTEGETDYEQYGSELTLGSCMVLESVPPFIKIDVVRTTGAVSVWVQPILSR